MQKHKEIGRHPPTQNNFVSFFLFLLNQLLYAIFAHSITSSAYGARQLNLLLYSVPWLAGRRNLNLRFSCGFASTSKKPPSVGLRMIRGQHQTKPAALAGSDFSLPIGSQSEFLISEWKPDTGMAGVQGNDKFCLKWNDFENNVSTAFQELREDRDFFDVTLACEGNQLEAHKVGWMDIFFLM